MKYFCFIQQFPLSLTGPALSWYSGLPIADTQDWIRCIFIKNFEPPDEPDIVMCAMVGTTELLDEDPPQIGTPTSLSTEL